MKTKPQFRHLLTTVTCFTIAAIISSCAPGPGESTEPLQSTARPADRSSPLGATPAGSSQAAAPRQRPGLGTGWGDEVDSSVNYTTFARANSKPAEVATIYYNDKEGIDAMTQYRKYTGKGMQRTADGLVEWGVKGSWGSLKNYHARYDSQNRRYVAGRKNSNYSLVVKNLCHSRLEVVLSVDGLDVIDGKSAAFKKRGYIIQPGKTLTVEGFRTSESAVAAFRFSSVANSYSNQRHSKTHNVGVIGMAVFTEKGIDPWKWSRHAIKQRHGASPFAEAPYAQAR